MILNPLKQNKLAAVVRRNMINQKIKPILNQILKNPRQQTLWLLLLETMIQLALKFADKVVKVLLIPLLLDIFNVLPNNFLQEIKFAI